MEGAARVAATTPPLELDPIPLGPAIRPERIKAWREKNELAGRILMRGGAWQI